jgi:hypothetical protein
MDRQAAYANAGEPRELFVIDGGTHFDFYDQPEYVEPAVAKIDGFFKAHLYGDTATNPGIFRLPDGSPPSSGINPGRSFSPDPARRHQTLTVP